MANVHISPRNRFTRQVRVFVDGKDVTSLCTHMYASPNPNEAVPGWAELITKDARGQIMISPDYTDIVSTIVYGIVMWVWKAQE